MHLFLAGAALTTLFNSVQAGPPPPVPPTLALSPALVGLNSSLGGRLAVGTPWPKSCFSSFNGKAQTPDPVACAFVQDNYFNVHCMFFIHCEYYPC